MSIFVIGFHGHAFVGKDTAADMLQDILGEGIVSHFAAPLKAMALALGVPHQYLYEPELKNVVIPEFGVTARHLLQTLGTEWGRSMIGPDVWLDSMKARHADLQEPLIIADVRFPNEAAWVRENGILVQMTGPVRGEISTDAQQHLSEAGIPTEVFDYYLDNGGTLDDLVRYVEDLARYVRVAYDFHKTLEKARG